MSPEPLLNEEEDYASSEDSDFAPDEAAAYQASEHSESEDDADKATGNKRNRQAGESRDEDAGYDNSGDEAIIERGAKRRKRARAKGAGADDDEGGEGGLIKTRRQRAAEKEERRYAANTGPVTIDVDAVWAQMLAGTRKTAEPDEAQDDDTANKQNRNDGKDREAAEPPSFNDDPSAMVRIKRTYNFAGRVHTEEKLVHRDSAEAKLYLASQKPDAPATEALPAKRVTRKAFHSVFEPLSDPLPQRADLNLGMAARMKAGKEAQAKKLNTVEKSRMDWAGYVDKEGIKDELELAGKSKGSYAAREDFLARSEARREDDARRVRMSGRA